MSIASEHYSLLAEHLLPHHKDDPDVRTLYVYDIDDDTAQWLDDVWDVEHDTEGIENHPDYNELRAVGTVENAVKLDLDLHDDGNVPAGEIFRRYTCDWDGAHTVLVWETISRNV